MKILKSLPILLMLVSSNAFPCSEASYPRSEGFAMADHVLLAKILSTRLIQEGAEDFGFDATEFVEATYETIEIFKGNDKPSILREVVEWSTMCSHLPVTPGAKYFLFLQGDARRIAFAGTEGSHQYISDEYQQEELLELRSLRDGISAGN